MLKEAIALLETKPGWPAAKVAVYDDQKALKENQAEEEKQPLTEARLGYVIRALDIVGKYYTELIDDLPTQKAVAVLLFDAQINSWVKFSGLPPDMVPPKHPIEGKQHEWTNFADRITDRAQHWMMEGLRRIKPKATDASTHSVSGTRKPRTIREPKSELLSNPEVTTLSRLRSAEALGISARQLDRWVKDGKLTPIGAGVRKRFRVMDLKRLLMQRNSDKQDIK